MSTDASKSQEGRTVDKTRYLPSESENWADWSAYQCGCCGENCINPTVSEFVEAVRCVRCFFETEDERLERLESRKMNQWMPNELPPVASTWDEVRK